MSKRKSKTPQKEPKPKLKTMNEISAAEAVKLFHAAMVLNDSVVDLYMPIPEGFPKDIAAKDFMDSLAVYRQWWSDREVCADGATGISYGYDEQIDEVARAAASLPKETLEESLAQLSPPQRKVFDRIVDGRHPRFKDLETDETLISDRTGKKMGKGTIKKHVVDLCKIFDVPNRKRLFTKVKSLLPPESTTRHP
jgi:hypothetical protein